MNIKAGDRILIGDDVTDPQWTGTVTEVIEQYIGGESRPLYRISFDNGGEGTFGPELITEVKEMK